MDFLGNYRHMPNPKNIIVCNIFGGTRKLSERYAARLKIP